MSEFLISIFNSIPIFKLDGTMYTVYNLHSFHARWQNKSQSFLPLLAWNQQNEQDILQIYFKVVQTKLEKYV